MTAQEWRGQNEYFYKEEEHTPQPGSANRGDFSFGGHRLSSLYRNIGSFMASLTIAYCAPSSLPKYSPGVRGWKTPAASAPHRRLPL